LLSVLPVIAGVILLFRLLVLPFQLPKPSPSLPAWAWVGLALLPLVYAYVRTGKNLRRVRSDESGRWLGGRLEPPPPLPPVRLGRVRWVIAICLLFAAVVPLYVFGGAPDPALQSGTARSGIRSASSAASIAWYPIPAVFAVAVAGYAVVLG